MVGPPRRKRAPNGSSTVTQRPVASPIPCRADRERATAASCCRGGPLGVLFANPAAAASTTGVYSAQPVYLFGIPVDFILFGLTLLGVAVFHHKTLEVALTGLAVVTLYKLLFTGFRQGEGLTGLVLQLHHEWVILANLFLLLMGFAILSRHFENSRIPTRCRAFLPDGWSGGLFCSLLFSCCPASSTTSPRP